MDDFAPWLGVFETLRVVEGVALFAAEHRFELQRAAAALQLEFDPNFLSGDQEIPRQSGRLRWVITPKGGLRIFNQEARPSAEPLDLQISTVRVGSQNWDARFKTVSYLSHAQAISVATTPEVVLLNEANEVASAARGNIFWRVGQRLYTPAHEAGCRCGVVRRFVLSRAKVADGFYDCNELLNADEVFITNSLRGITSVRSLESRAITDFSAADALRNAYEEECRRMISSPPESDIR